VAEPENELEIHRRSVRLGIYLFVFFCVAFAATIVVAILYLRFD
jgi:hypothetical protein